MGENIRMSPGDMITRAGQFDSSCQEFIQVRSTMQNLVNSLAEEWEGVSSRAFTEQFEQLRPSFDATQDLITQIAEQLREISASMESFDNDMAKKMGVN